MARGEAQTPTYIRRDELAREQGFDSYQDKREAIKELNNDDYFRDSFFGGEEITGRTTKGMPEYDTYSPLDIARLRDEAFATKDTDHEVGGLRYILFVEVLGIMDQEEWEELYG